MEILSIVRIYLFIVIYFICFQRLSCVRSKVLKPTSFFRSSKRDRTHFKEILLKHDPKGYDETNPNTVKVLEKLRQIYHQKIKPVESKFHYSDLRRHVMGDADIYAKPIILVAGPWSTGKTTLINYLLEIDDKLERLYTGAQPTTSDFTVVTHGDDYRTIEGVVLATDPTQPFGSMEKFGQHFLEHLLGIEMNVPLLKNVTFIDTPGILENRRQQERGYPYNDVMRWLVHRSDLILLMFDPTKLDVGIELETLFKQIKGKESALRIILNKADSLDEKELMRVYGSLFWALSPLINVTEAPRIYVGSFWSEKYRQEELGELLLTEEKSLLKDMYEVVRNRIYMKIAFLRQYAIRVRVHAYLIDSYASAYRRHKGYFVEDEDLARNIVSEPESYDVYKLVLAHPNVSQYDLPEPDEYEEYFKINPLIEQQRLSDVCTYFTKKCIMDDLNHAISHDLPTLLKQYQQNAGGSGEDFMSSGAFCSKDSTIPCPPLPNFAASAAHKYRKQQQQYNQQKSSKEQQKFSKQVQQNNKEELKQNKWRKKKA